MTLPQFSFSGRQAVRSYLIKRYDEVNVLQTFVYFSLWALCFTLRSISSLKNGNEIKTVRKLSTR